MEKTQEKQEITAKKEYPIMKSHVEQAFHMYVAMGGDRSLVRLAKELKVPASRVRAWNTKNHWSSRLRDIDQRVAEKLKKEAEKSVIESVVAIKKRQADIAKIVISNMMKRLNQMIQDGIGLDFNVSDLEKMMKHELLVTGAATESTGINPVTLFNINLSAPAQKLDDVIQKLTPQTRMEVIRILKEQGKQKPVNNVIEDK